VFGSPAEGCFSADNANRFDGRMVFVPEGRHDSSQARSAWSAVWTFIEGHVGEFSPRRSYGQSVARSGLKSVAQGLPGFTLGSSPHPNSPEGAMRYRDNRLGTFEPDRVRISSPFRAKRLFWLTPG
jgi:hypothetical protein